MSVTVAAVGMVTALGLDWETSCAAARAGIRRMSVLDHFPFQTAEAGEPQFANGHQAELVTRGFEGFGRLINLLAAAMRDLRARVLEPSLLNAGVFLSMPDPLRGASESVDLEDADEALEEPPGALALRLVTQACQLAHWPSPPRLDAMSFVGHAGFAEVLQQAMTELRSEKTQYCLVGGVDSLLDEDTLTWLVGSDRLKHPGNAAGITPGEGCVLMLLGGRSTSPADICTIEGVSLGKEPCAYIEEKHADGAGIWQAAGSLLSETRPAEGLPSLTTDHNGEIYRAREFGGFLLRLKEWCRADGDPYTVMPAASFGDTAAASGAMAVATAAHSFARGYARSDRNLVLSTSDGTARGAILVAGGSRRN